MRRLVALLCLLAAGCISGSNVPSPQYYLLTDSGRPPEARHASAGGRVLLVHPTSVNAFYDTQRLVYSRAPGERAYYQFAAWTERPGRAFAELLSRRLDAPLTTAGVRGDLILRTRLDELYHDASSAPGRVTIEVSAELVDAAGRRLGDGRRFTRSVPTRAANAAAAVEAANRAVTEVLDDIAAWCDRAAREERPTASTVSLLFRP
jgi:cholesterol transport system auxiliary component